MLRSGSGKAECRPLVNGSVSEAERRLLSKRLVSHSDHVLPNAVTVLFCHCCSGWGSNMSGNVTEGCRR